MDVQGAPQSRAEHDLQSVSVALCLTEDSPVTQGLTTCLPLVLRPPLRFHRGIPGCREHSREKHGTPNLVSARLSLRSICCHVLVRQLGWLCLTCPDVSRPGDSTSEGREGDFGVDSSKWWPGQPVKGGSLVRDS